MPKFDVTKLSTATKERSRFRLALSAVLAIALAAGLAIMVRSEVRAADARRRTASSNPHPKAARSSAIPARVEQNPEREAFFGETHVHTSWSFDAYIYGNTKAGPEDAYKFAMGQTITHPGGYPIKITRPLDFMAVTDHAEYVGVIPRQTIPAPRLASCPSPNN